MTGENNGMYMPVAPAYGGMNDSMFGGNGAWWIIILLAVLGWGNGFGGGFGCNNGGGFVNADIQRGFDQNAVMNGINNLTTAQCNGFAGVNQAIANGFAQAEIGANSRQMAEMNQNFALQSAFQNCCCENRLATAGLQTAIAQEGANTRANCNANHQAVMDKLCQLELDGIKQNYENRIAGMQNTIDAVRAENLDLRNGIARTADRAAIIANNEAQTAALEQYLAPVPRPAYIVQNPNCCANGFGYGGCGGYAG